jgi:dTMP kinase
VLVLVTIEGIDGSGKSSLVSSLERLLSDQNPVFTREPGSTWVGDQVRRAVAERVDPVTEALLFAADHAAHLSTLVRPSLRQGRLVVSDRYSDSRYAYQQETLKGYIGEPLEWLLALHAGWTIRPDLTFLIVLPVEEALSRVGNKPVKEHFENHDLLTRVQENYLALAEKDPSRFAIIDGLKGEEEIAAFVAGTIRDSFARSRSHRQP